MDPFAWRVSRRGFCASGLAAALTVRSLERRVMAGEVSDTVRTRAVTRGPKHHFFGYYEKCPWDATGRWLLAMQSAFMDRMPRPDDRLVLGRIDLASADRFEPFDETVAWCWQMGTMLRWVPRAEDRTVAYNMREGDAFYSVMRDLASGAVRRLPRPLYTISPDGRYALTLNFSRLARNRPGYGYEGGRDPTAGELRPADDGIFRVDMATGEIRLILSLDAAAALRPLDSMKDAEHWFNHIQINTDGSRFAVLHRWRRLGAKSWTTRALTANPDGSDVFILADEGYFSHYDWMTPDRLVGHAQHAPAGKRYYLYTDRTDKREVLGEGILTTDGHCSFSPDRRWMLTDTYPDKEHKRTLLLYRMSDGKRVDLGRFYAPPELEGPLRCDLHPRWSRDGRAVCIDSAHEGTRQMYVLDVSGIVKA